jgi:hypothetical protein
MLEAHKLVKFCRSRNFFQTRANEMNDTAPET